MAAAGVRKLLEVKVIEARGCGESTANVIQATLLDFTKNKIEKAKSTSVKKTPDPVYEGKPNTILY